MQSEVIKDLEEKMECVPFGQSAFQILNFIAGKEKTPERQYRTILLQMSEKLKALKSTEFARKKTEIDIEELKEKLNSAEGFDKKRKIVEIEEKEWELKNQVKLINDAIEELNVYYSVYEKLPKDITRESFEKAEHAYWANRLIADAEAQLFSIGSIEQGTLQSLNQIGINVKRNKETNSIQYEIPKQLLIEAEKDGVKP